MAKFEYIPPEDTNEDRVYVRVDDIFDISILRREEGLVIDVYDGDDELLGSLHLDNPEMEG